ncbi:MAG: hypothetical protein RBR23_01105 [Arcobacteraceae bacterium]|jgi:hypothetical protein|nr:hypothetical protein [Arcobacteraceae bacterium]
MFNIIKKKIDNVDTIIFLKNSLIVLVILNVIAPIFAKGFYLNAIHFLTVLFFIVAIFMFFQERKKDKNVVEDEDEFVED